MPPDNLDDYLDPLPAPAADRPPARGGVDYDEIIGRHARRTGLDPGLISAVAYQESRFNPNAVSPKGARGPMQLMGPTARRFGVTNPHDPEQAIRGGSDYLKFLSDRYHGDTDRILAGYNAGEGAVDKYHGIPPYAETQNYVRTIKQRMGQQTRPAPAPTPANLDDYLDPLPGGGGKPENLDDYLDPADFSAPDELSPGITQTLNERAPPIPTLKDAPPIPTLRARGTQPGLTGGLGPLQPSAEPSALVHGDIPKPVPLSSAAITTEAPGWSMESEPGTLGARPKATIPRTRQGEAVFTPPPPPTPEEQAANLRTNVRQQVIDSRTHGVIDLWGLKFNSPVSLQNPLTRWEESYGQTSLLGTLGQLTGVTAHTDPLSQADSIDRETNQRVQEIEERTRREKEIWARASPAEQDMQLFAKQALLDHVAHNSDWWKTADAALFDNLAGMFDLASGVVRQNSDYSAPGLINRALGNPLTAAQIFPDFLKRTSLMLADTVREIDNRKNPEHVRASLAAKVSEAVLRNAIPELGRMAPVALAMELGIPPSAAFAEHAMALSAANEAPLATQIGEGAKNYMMGKGMEWAPMFNNVEEAAEGTSVARQLGQRALNTAREAGVVGATTFIPETLGGADVNQALNATLSNVAFHVGMSAAHLPGELGKMRDIAKATPPPPSSPEVLAGAAQRMRDKEAELTNADPYGFRNMPDRELQKQFNELPNKARRLAAYNLPDADPFHTAMGDELSRRGFFHANFLWEGNRMQTGPSQYRVVVPTPQIEGDPHGIYDLPDQELRKEYNAAPMKVKRALSREQEEAQAANPRLGAIFDELLNRNYYPDVITGTMVKRTGLPPLPEPAAAAAPVGPAQPPVPGLEAEATTEAVAPGEVKPSGRTRAELRRDIKRAQDQLRTPLVQNNEAMRGEWQKQLAQDQAELAQTAHPSDNQARQAETGQFAPDWQVEKVAPRKYRVRWRDAGGNPQELVMSNRRNLEGAAQVIRRNLEEAQQARTETAGRPATAAPRFQAWAEAQTGKAFKELDQETVAKLAGEFRGVAAPAPAPVVAAAAAGVPPEQRGEPTQHERIRKLGPQEYEVRTPTKPGQPDKVWTEIKSLAAAEDILRANYPEALPSKKRHNVRGPDGKFKKITAAVKEFKEGEGGYLDPQEIVNAINALLKRRPELTREQAEDELRRTRPYLFWAGISAQDEAAMKAQETQNLAREAVARVRAGRAGTTEYEGERIQDLGNVEAQRPPGLSAADQYAEASTAHLAGIPQALLDTGIAQAKTLAKMKASIDKARAEGWPDEVIKEAIVTKHPQIPIRVVNDVFASMDEPVDLTGRDIDVGQRGPAPERQAVNAELQRRIAELNARRGTDNPPTQAERDQLARDLRATGRQTATLADIRDIIANSEPEEAAQHPAFDSTYNQVEREHPEFSINETYAETVRRVKEMPPADEVAMVQATIAKQDAERQQELPQLIQEITRLQQVVNERAAKEPASTPATATEQQANRAYATELINKFEPVRLVNMRQGDIDNYRLRVENAYAREGLTREQQKALSNIATVLQNMEPTPETPRKYGTHPMDRGWMPYDEAGNKLSELPLAEHDHAWDVVRESGKNGSVSSWPPPHPTEAFLREKEAQGFKYNRETREFEPVEAEQPPEPTAKTQLHQTIAGLKDEAGQPLKFFHGSPVKGLTEMRASSYPVEGDYGRGLHLTSKLKDAEDYSRGRGANIKYLMGELRDQPPLGQVYELDPPWENPLIIHTDADYTKLETAAFKKLERRPGDEESVPDWAYGDRAIAAVARKEGYDGIINIPSGEHVYWGNKKIAPQIKAEQAPEPPARLHKRNALANATLADYPPDSHYRDPATGRTLQEGESAAAAEARFHELTPDSEVGYSRYDPQARVVYVDPMLASLIGPERSSGWASVSTPGWYGMVGESAENRATLYQRAVAGILPERLLKARSLLTNWEEDRVRARAQGTLRGVMSDKDWRAEWEDVLNNYAANYLTALDDFHQRVDVPTVGVAHTVIGKYSQVVDIADTNTHEAVHSVDPMVGYRPELTDPNKFGAHLAEWVDTVMREGASQVTPYTDKHNRVAHIATETLAQGFSGIFEEKHRPLLVRAMADIIERTVEYYGNKPVREMANRVSTYGQDLLQSVFDEIAHRRAETGASYGGLQKGWTGGADKSARASSTYETNRNPINGEIQVTATRPDGTRETTHFRTLADAQAYVDHETQPPPVKQKEPESTLHTMDDIRAMAKGEGTVNLYHGGPRAHLESMAAGKPMPYQTAGEMARAVAKAYDIPPVEFLNKTGAGHLVRSYADRVRRISTAPAEIARRWEKSFPLGEVMTSLDGYARLYTEAKRRGIPFDEFQESLPPKDLHKQADELGLPSKFDDIRQQGGALARLQVDARALPKQTQREAAALLRRVEQGRSTEAEALADWNNSYHDTKIAPQNVQQATLVGTPEAEGGPRRFWNDETGAWKVGGIRDALLARKLKLDEAVDKARGELPDWVSPLHIQTVLQRTPDQDPLIGLTNADETRSEADPFRRFMHAEVFPKYWESMGHDTSRWRYEPQNQTVYWEDNPTAEESAQLRNHLAKQGLEVKHDAGLAEHSPPRLWATEMDTQRRANLTPRRRPPVAAPAPPSEPELAARDMQQAVQQLGDNYQALMNHQVRTLGFRDSRPSAVNGYFKGLENFVKAAKDPGDFRFLQQARTAYDRGDYNSATQLTERALAGSQDYLQRLNEGYKAAQQAAKGETAGTDWRVPHGELIRKMARAMSDFWHGELGAATPDLSRMPRDNKPHRILGPMVEAAVEHLWQDARERMIRGELDVTDLRTYVRKQFGEMLTTHFEDWSEANKKGALATAVRVMQERGYHMDPIMHLIAQQVAEKRMQRLAENERPPVPEPVDRYGKSLSEREASLAAEQAALAKLDNLTPLALSRRAKKAFPEEYKADPNHAIDLLYKQELLPGEAGGRATFVKSWKAEINRRLNRRATILAKERAAWHEESGHRPEGADENPPGPWQTVLHQLDAAHAADSEYKKVMSEVTKQRLKPGETWRGRVQAMAAQEIRQRAEDLAGEPRVLEMPKGMKPRALYKHLEATGRLPGGRPFYSPEHLADWKVTADKLIADHGADYAQEYYDGAKQSGVRTAVGTALGDYYQTEGVRTGNVALIEKAARLSDERVLGATDLGQAVVAFRGLSRETLGGALDEANRLYRKIKGVDPKAPLPTKIAMEVTKRVMRVKEAKAQAVKVIEETAARMEVPAAPQAPTAPRPNEFRKKIARLEKEMGSRLVDTDYRRLLSTGTKDPLKRGETWKKRLYRYADLEDAKIAEEQADPGLAGRFLPSEEGSSPSPEVLAFRARKKAAGAAYRAIQRVTQQNNLAFKQAHAELRDASFELNELMDGLKREGTPYYVRANNLVRSFMVSAFSTHMRNAESQGVRTATERATDAIELAMRGPLGLDTDLTVGGIFRGITQIGQLSLNRKYGFSKPRMTAEQILMEHPDEISRMFTTYAGGKGVKGLAGALGERSLGTRAMTRLLGGAEKAAFIFNYFNRIQEFHIRSAEFVTDLDNNLRKTHNLTLEQFLKHPDYGAAKLDKELIGRSIDKALGVTFAANPPRNTYVGRQLNNAIELGNFFPPTLTPVAFPRFMYNNLKFLYEYSPLGLVDMARVKARAERGESIARPVARAVVGAALMTMAAATRVKLGGDKWWEVRLPFTNQYMDARPFGPFSTYLLLAEAGRRYHTGERPLSLRDWAEGLGSTTSVGGLSQAMIERAYNFWAQHDWDRAHATLLTGLKQEAGEVGRAVLTPIRQVKDLLAQFYKSEGVAHDTSLAPFTGPIRESIPFASRGLPEAHVPTTATPLHQQQPGLKLLGPRIETPKTFLQHELDRLHFDPKEIRSGYTGDATLDSAATRHFGPLSDTYGAKVQADPRYAQASDKMKFAILTAGMNALNKAANARAAKENPEAYRSYIVRKRLPYWKRQLLEEKGVPLP